MFTISEDEVIKLFSEVPFLNGGLFECLDKTKTIDGVEQAYNYDGSAVTTRNLLMDAIAIVRLCQTFCSLNQNEDLSPY